MVNDFSLFISCGENVICFAFLEKRTGETERIVAFINSGRLLRVRCVAVERGVYQKARKAWVASVSNNGRHRKGVFAVRGGRTDFKVFFRTEGTSCKRCFNYDNAIKGGVFNINIASSQNPVSSPESEDPKKMFHRLTCIESNSGSSQEN